MLLQMGNIYSFYGQVIFHCMCMHVSLCMSITLRLLQIFAIVNSATMNIGVNYLFKLVFLFSLDIYPGMELLDDMVVQFLVF